MKIHHLAISVRDSEKSARFYKNCFGFKEVNRFTKPGWQGGAVVLELNDLQLEIFGFNDWVKNNCDLSNLKIIGIKHFGIEVTDVRKYYADLKNKGVDIDEPIRGTTCAWFCFLRDPDGIPVELYEP